MDPRERRSEPVSIVNAMQRMGTVAHLLRQIDAEVATMLKSHEYLENKLAVRDRVIRDLRRSNTDLTRAKVELEHRVAELERERDELIAERLRSLPDVSTADNLGHQQLTGQFETFVRQDLPALLRLLDHNDAMPSPDRQRRIAHTTGRILKLLFVDGLTDADELLSTLEIEASGIEYRESAARVCAVAGRLRETAAELDNPQGWTFDYLPGTRINPAIQIQWRGCDPEAPVEFVVVPGYQARNRIYRQQQVFTQM